MPGLASGVPAFGTLIKVSDGASPNVFQTIAGVKDIKQDTSVTEAETTTHSTSSPHRTFVPTLIDDGSLNFTVNFDPSHDSHSLTSDYGLEYLFQNRVRNRVWQLWSLKDDGSYRKQQFTGFIAMLSANFPLADVQTRDVKLRITSAPEDIA